MRVPMRNAVLLTLLALANSSAMAAWVTISESATGIVYVDPVTLTRAGNRATLWEMTDYKIVPDENNPYRSVKRQHEFDCQEMAKAAAAHGPFGLCVEFS